MRVLIIVFVYVVDSCSRTYVEIVRESTRVLLHTLYIRKLLNEKRKRIRVRRVTLFHVWKFR